MYYYKRNQKPFHGFVKMKRILKGVDILEEYPGDVEVTIDSSYQS